MADFNPSWTVKEHIIPASHPRGYRRGVRDPQNSRLKLHVKQYVPATHFGQGTAVADDDFAVTLIIQHGQPPGNKEAYEPFMWDLINQSSSLPIRAIWAMDIVSSGQSFLMNREEIGDQHHWFDASRDTVQMINHFQTEMKPPIIGIGQSWGAAVLTMAAASNPRLFRGLVLCEPVFENGYYHDPPNAPKVSKLAGLGRAVAPGLAKRQRHFTSRAELDATFERARMWKTYDVRVIQQIMRYDYRELEDGRVELVTPPAQTSAYFLNPAPPLEGFPENEDFAGRPADSDYPSGFYSAQGAVGKRVLGDLTCPLLFLWDKHSSFISDNAYKKRVIDSAERLQPGHGRIEQLNLDGGHSLPLQNPLGTAGAVSAWLVKIWNSWVGEERQRSSDVPIDAENLSKDLLARIDAIRGYQRGDPGSAMVRVKGKL